MGCWILLRVYPAYTGRVDLQAADNAQRMMSAYIACINLGRPTCLGLSKKSNVFRLGIIHISRADAEAFTELRRSSSGFISRA